MSKVTDTLERFTMANIVGYFVEAFAADSEKSNDFKSLRESSFSMFNEGHVQKNGGEDRISEYHHQMRLLARDEKGSSLQHHGTSGTGDRRQEKLNSPSVVVWQVKERELVVNT